MATLDQLIGSWTLSLRAPNRVPCTVARYVVESLAQRAPHEGTRARAGAAATALQHVESHLAEIASTRSASTAQTRYQALRLFFAWAPAEGEVPSDAMANVKPLMVPEQPVPVLSDDELRALLASCTSKVFEDRRDTAIIRVLLDTGMRRDELVGLRLADVDVLGHVAVVLGKGRRERGCPFGDKTAARSATRPPSLLIATCACARPTGLPTRSGSGWPARAHSPRPARADAGAPR